VHAYLTGVMTASIQISGHGRSTADIQGSLDGQGRIELRNCSISHLVTELAGLDIAQALGVMVRGDRPLPMRCARLDLVSKRGVVQPRIAVLDNRDSTLRIGGQIDLRDETLALRAESRSKDFSLLALRTPITVGGTLGVPQIGIESRRPAGRVLGAVVQGALVAPAAALLPFVDPGEPEAGDPCADAARPLPTAAATSSAPAQRLVPAGKAAPRRG
jgi:uncharacterized protein involved in outer membrane biogenesis